MVLFSRLSLLVLLASHLLFNHQIFVSCSQSQPEKQQIPIIIGMNASSNCTLPIEQYEALYDIYVATDGANWILDEGEVAWNFTNPSINAPCTDHWVGIVCYECN